MDQRQRTGLSSSTRATPTTAARSIPGTTLLNALGGGWTITGISTWQHGGYIPAVGSVNFGLGLQYTGLPADTSGASCYSSGTYNSNNCSLAKDTGITNAIGDPTYFGTDESIPIRPVLTCNPNNGLATHQVLNGSSLQRSGVGGRIDRRANGGLSIPI